MIRYAITAMNKHGLRINIFINKKTYPTLKGVRRAMLTYADSFSPDADLRYEEVEVETELEIAQKQLSQKDEMIKILREALEFYANGKETHIVRSEDNYSGDYDILKGNKGNFKYGKRARQALSEADKMKGV